MRAIVGSHAITSNSKSRTTGFHDSQERTEKKRVQNYRVRRIHRYPKTLNNSQPPERKKGKNRVGPHVMTERHEPPFLISKNLLSEELDKVKKPNKIGCPFPSKDKNNRS